MSTVLFIVCLFSMRDSCLNVGRAEAHGAVYSLQRGSLRKTCSLGLSSNHRPAAEIANHESGSGGGAVVSLSSLLLFPPKDPDNQLVFPSRLQS